MTESVRDYWEMVLNGYSLLCLDTNTGYAGEVEYKFFSFFVFAHHMVDHLNLGQPTPPSELQDYIESREPLRRCRDICNATKHYRLHRASRSDVGRGRPGLSQEIRVHPRADGSPGAASVHWMLSFEDGGQVEALELASDIVLAWADFGLDINSTWLDKHGLA